MKRVLVVDDEPQILRALSINLRARGHEVHTASTGREALAQASSHRPDIVVLDLGLPDIDGVEVIRGLRGWTDAPILVLSGRTDSGDKVEALDEGADDYVTKPFGVDELLARMRAVSRRATPAAAQPAVSFGQNSILTYSVVAHLASSAERLVGDAALATASAFFGSRMKRSASISAASTRT